MATDETYEEATQALTYANTMLRVEGERLRAENAALRTKVAKQESLHRWMVDSQNALDEKNANLREAVGQALAALERSHSHGSYVAIPILKEALANTAGRR